MPNKSTNVRTSYGVGWLRAGFVALSPFPGLAARWAEALFFSPPRTPRSGWRAAPGGRRLDVQTPDLGRIVAWAWGDGPAVYLMHGWGGWSGQWTPFLAPLLAEGLSVVAVDAPGHGASDGRRSSIPEFARALRAVIGAGRPAHAVVAHSLGASAIVMAMKEGLEVGRAVFLGPPADPVEYTRAFGIRLGVSPTALSRMLARVERRLRVRFADLNAPPQVRGFSRTPLLVVHDRGDREVPWRDGAAIAQAWPDARLVTTSGLGHRRMLREPSVARLVASFVTGGDVGEAAYCPGCGSPRGDEACTQCAFESLLFNRETRWEPSATPCP